jgi:chromosome partitioning protein
LTCVLAIANQKGGSGKTTTAVNLGAALAERGRAVLLVDLDAQASASAWLGCRNLHDGLVDVFTGDARLTDLAQFTCVERMRSGLTEPGDTAVAQAIDPHHALRRAIPEGGRYDYLLFDCPPALGHVVIAALAAAEQLLIPVAAHAMELDGLAAVHRTAEAVRSRMNPALELRVLACRVDARTRLAGEVVEALRSRLGPAVLSTVVRENVRVAEAPSHEQPVLSYAPLSAGAQDDRAVAAELEAVSIRA